MLALGISNLPGSKYMDGEYVFLVLASSLVCCLGSVAHVIFRTMDLFVNSCRLSYCLPPLDLFKLSVFHIGSGVMFLSQHFLYSLVFIFADNSCEYISNVCVFVFQS